MTAPRLGLYALLAAALLAGHSARAEHTPGVPGWQQDVHYSISASYAPARFEIAGRETLAYWNLSPDTLSELYFHLYLNAFRPGSHMARRDAYFEDWKIENLPARRRGSETIERASLLGGDSLSVHADDTVARLPLPGALAPGESVIVCLQFRSVIPDVPERMGRSGKGIFAAQWFPKVAVYDRFGWHAEQHLGSEFYGDFGAYDVRITLPGSFLLAHTGTLVNAAEILPDSIRARLEAPGDSAVTIWDRSLTKAPSDSAGRRVWDLPRTWVIHADSVHDFAWACDEKWIWRRARWNGIQIYTFHRAADSKRWMDMAGEGARMMEFLNHRFGPYPYPTFSFVEEPIGAGGVEFPNIVWITPRRSAMARRLEYLFAHELAHNWFQGMVGSNETSQAFLDEGLTSFSETAIMEALYGREGNLTLARKPGWLYPRDDSRRTAWRNYLEFQASGIEEPVVTHSDRFRNPAAYYPSVYHKTNVGLWALRSIAGEDRFDAAMREYFATWRFHHPYAEDFFASMNHALGQSYDWFWNGWFVRTDRIDLQLTKMRVARDGIAYSVELDLRSRGGIDPPVPVRFRDSHGHETRRTIPRDVFLGAAGEGSYKTTLSFRPAEAELDPDFTLPDVSWSDNSTKWNWRFQPMLDNWRSSPAPIGKTLLLWRPDLWYQTEDGVQGGVAFDASTVRWEHALHGLAGMGARKPRPFADFEARFRALSADPKGILRIRGYGMDGHDGYRVSLTKPLGSKIDRGYRWTLSGGIDQDRIYDRGVPRRPLEWSDGGYANLEAQLSSVRKFRRVLWSGSVRLRTDLLSQRVSYGSIYGATTAEVTAIPKLPLHLRAVAGVVRGDAIPPEERFYLAGAGPRGEWQSRWFRSRGTLPTRWTAALGGDGNVRGFADTRPSGRRLVAVNAETRSGRLIPAWVPLLSKLRVPVLDPRMSLFADGGKVGEEDITLKDVTADLGVGFRTKPLFRNHLVLRTDLPLWRTPPQNGERPWKLRAVFSVGEAF